MIGEGSGPGSIHTSLPGTPSTDNHVVLICLRIFSKVPDITSNYSDILLVPPAAAGVEKGKQARPESPPGSLAIALRQGDCVPLLSSYI